MASVFVSYDRDDAIKARAIAEGLENAGHSVWWDFRIQGGAEFNKEIEQALARADAVVVLWSELAVESAWVRDEAAAGRDTGRLVPVRLDEARPPLGFRQYQCVDLSVWKGRGRPPLRDVLTAIDRVPPGSSHSPSNQESRSKLRRSKRSHMQLLAVLSLLLIGIGALASLFWQPWRGRQQAPLVAVVPAIPSPAAKALAGDLLVKLDVLQSSHADALQLVEVGSRQTPDFIIKVGGATSEKVAQANLMLVDNRSDTLLWAREFTAPSGKRADLRQQMAYSAAQVLDCAVQALLHTNEPIKLPTLKLYLSGCADTSNLMAQDPKVAAAMFERVTEQAPTFKGGWKKLILAEIQALRFVFGTDQSLRQSLEKHITHARRLDPAMAEAALAEGFLLPPKHIARTMQLLDRAVAADPDNPDLLAYRSMALTNVGLLQEALADSRRAVKADPLSPSARETLITGLLNSDQIEAAKIELQKSEQLWPGATTVLQSRFAVEFRAGDPVRAMEIMKSGQLGAAFVTNAAHESYLQARIDPTSRNKELAIIQARFLQLREPSASWVYARALSEFGRHEDLVDFLLRTDPRIPYTTTWVIFRSSFSVLHKDRRFMMIAHRFGVSDFWRDTGRWPDLCGRPDIPYDCKAEVAKLS